MAIKQTSHSYVPVINKKEEKDLNINIRYIKNKKQQTDTPADPKFLQDLKNSTIFQGDPNEQRDE